MRSGLGGIGSVGRRPDPFTPGRGSSGCTARSGPRSDRLCRLRGPHARQYSSRGSGHARSTPLRPTAAEIAAHERHAWTSRNTAADTAHNDRGGAMGVIGVPAFFVLILGLVALSRGRLAWARIHNRRTAGIVTGVAGVVLAAAVALDPPPPAPVAAPVTTTAPAPTVSSAATPAPRSTTTPSATTTSPTPTQPPVLTTSVALAQPPAAVTTKPDYTVPKYVPPPPDADGNPPCRLPDTWDTAVTGAGISATVYRDPTEVTVTVRKKSGVDESQSARIKPGQSLHQFDFPGVDKSSVAEVLAYSDGSRCYVTVF
jgi:hypothetical protein